MKKITKILIVTVIAIVMVTALVACSSMPKVRKAFEKEGYTYSEEAADFLKSFEKEAEKADIEVTFHLFTKGIVMAGVIEFKSSSDMNKMLEENATLKGLIKDLQKSDIINGNCLLVPMSLTQATKQIEIFKNA